MIKRSIKKLLEIGWCCLFVLGVSSGATARGQQLTVGHGRLSAGLPAANPGERVEDRALFLEGAAAMASGFMLPFRRTDLDARAEATAQVMLRDGSLIVQIRAANLPVPSFWNERSYSLWVYFTNYDEKVCLGELPLLLSSARSEEPREDGQPVRARADSTFRTAAIPAGALFGGLILTIEPPRYEPILNEPLRPVLVAHAADGEIDMGSLNARATHRVILKYSPTTSRTHTHDWIKVVLAVNESGEVSKVVKVKGYVSFEKEAREAARRFKFRPLVIGKQRVGYTGFITFTPRR